MYVSMNDGMNDPFDSIDTAVAHLANGGIVVVADDENRENEGDLIMAADPATTPVQLNRLAHGEQHHKNSGVLV